MGRLNVSLDRYCTEVALEGSIGMASVMLRRRAEDTWRLLLAVFLMVAILFLLVPPLPIGRLKPVAANTPTPSVVQPRIPPAQMYGPPDSGIGFAANPSGYWRLLYVPRGGVWANTATGSLVTSTVDAGLPGIDLPFVFGRSYTSQDDRASSLGKGWTDNYDWNLTFSSQRNATVHSGSGQQLVFRWENGTYTGARGSLAKLVSVQSGYLLTLHNQVSYLFGSGGELQAIVSSNKNAIRLNYDAGGSLSSITDTAGRHISFRYNQSGLIAQLVLPDQRIVRYQYADGLLSSVIDERGGITRYTYSGRRLSTVTDPERHTIAIAAYDQQGRLTRVTDSLGHIVAFRYQGETTTVTDPRGHQWTYVHSGNALISQTDPLGHSIRISYTPNLQIATLSDAEGHIWRADYDAAGNVVKTTAPSPLSYQQSFSYDAANRLVQAIDGRGATTRFSYDANGNLTEVKQPLDTVARISYDSRGLLTSMRDADGRLWEYGHDAAGNLASALSPVQSKMVFVYDGTGHLVRLMNANGHVSSFQYNAADQPVTLTDAMGHALSFTYDADGRLTQRKDENGHNYRYRYDPRGYLVEVSTPLNEVAHYAYDAAGNLASFIDANGHATSYRYDAANDLVEVASPIGQRWKYSYDAAGNLEQVVKPGGGAITHTYDALNRLVRTSFSDGTPAVTYTYDADSNRVQMADGGGMVSYVYDALNRLTSSRRGNLAFSYSYDAAGFLVNEAYPSGASIAFAYDPAGRVLSLSVAGNTIRFTHDAVGNLLQRHLPGGVDQYFTYDSAERPVSVRITGPRGILSQVTYTLDGIGLPVSQTTPASTRTFTYDADGRLLRVCFNPNCAGGSDPFIRYSYDKVGNRLSETRATGVTRYVYNSATELLSTAGPKGNIHYAYDAAGDEIARGNDSFSYDVAGELRHAIVNKLVTSFTYDGDNRRLMAIPAERGALATTYLWGPRSGKLVGIRQGSLLLEYLYGTGLSAQLSGGSPHFYLSDGRSSISYVAASNGSLESAYDYEPFGAVRGQTRTQNVPNARLYRGQYLDPRTGLYLRSGRDYDSLTGRYLEPLRSAQGPDATTPFGGVSADVPMSLVGQAPLIPDCRPFALQPLCWIIFRNWSTVPATTPPLVESSLPTSAPMPYGAPGTAAWLQAQVNRGAVNRSVGFTISVTVGDPSCWDYAAAGLCILAGVTGVGAVAFGVAGMTGAALGYGIASGSEAALSGVAWWVGNDVASAPPTTSGTPSSSPTSTANGSTDASGGDQQGGDTYDSVCGDSPGYSYSFMVWLQELISDVCGPGG